MLPAIGSALDQPIGDEEFAGLMAGLGGFEPAPRLAVAVSGGADSLALCLLCQRWAAARGGSVTAVTVDHRLRLESTQEAEAVGRLLRGRGIDHHRLSWDDAKPATGLQAAARAARYHLLIDHCRARRWFHLLLAHHRDDQAETLLQRLAHASGSDGLAAMAAVRELPALRLLRPLLNIAKRRLIATCVAAGLPWHEDPSNHSARFARGRLRAAAGGLEAAGLSAESLQQCAHRLGQTRAALDQITAALLAQAATVDEAGFIGLDRRRLLAAPAEIGRRALVRALMVVSGGDFVPRQSRLERLFAEIAHGLEGGRTLAGCRIIPSPDRARLLVVREARACAGPEILYPGGRLWWDRRFSATWPGPDQPELGQPELQPDRGPLTLAALGAEGWRQARKHADPAASRRIPGPARLSLPALWSGNRLLAVPHLGAFPASDRAPPPVNLLFIPALPLAGAAFAVV